MSGAATVKIKTALHYGTFEAELDDDTAPSDLMDERGLGPVVSFWALDQGGARFRITMRKKDITSVEEEA